MEIFVTHEPVSQEKLEELAKAWYLTMVKGVADIERGVVALGGEWHMDANVRLLEEGSTQPNLWGFNLYINETGDRAIEYISLINIRPAQNNRSMEIEDKKIQLAIRTLMATIAPHLGL